MFWWERGFLPGQLVAGVLPGQLFWWRQGFLPGQFIAGFASSLGGSSPVSVLVVGPVDEDEAAVLAANQRFYDAFERRDLDLMSEVWERSSRARCTHPGWGTLRGWSQVSASFFALFRGAGTLQFLLTQQDIMIDGNVAWVSVDENLLGDQGGSTVAALNVFVKDGRGRWRVVAHHGSVVNGPLPPFPRRPSDPD